MTSPTPRTMTAEEIEADLADREVEIAREVAQALGAKPTEVREALATALAAERRRRAELVTPLV